MITIDVQNILGSPEIPDTAKLSAWLNHAARSMNYNDDKEIVVRFVADSESATLNQQYRNKSGATNVLSFPSTVPDVVASNLLGDLVIAVQLLEREAKEQGKSSEQHFAHLVIHGFLHLIGYDHQTDSEALVMEQKEIDILAELNFPNPWRE